MLDRSIKNICCAKSKCTYKTGKPKAGNPIEYLVARYSIL